MFTVSDSRRKVLVLYTGGTMGMRHMENGSLAPAPGYLTENVRELPELNRCRMHLLRTAVTIKPCYVGQRCRNS